MTDTKQHPTDLLPFIVNDTLNGYEREKVESHILDCEQCQQELLLLKSMREAVKLEPPIVADELAWHRLKRDMKQKTNARIKSSIWWKPAIATAAALVIAIQSVLLYKIDPGLNSYTQAGHHEKASVVQVKFNPNAREEQIRKVLLDIDAEIIAGPSAAGLYRIRLTYLHDDPASEIKIKTLKGNKLVINYIARE